MNAESSALVLNPEPPLQEASVAPETKVAPRDRRPSRRGLWWISLLFVMGALAAWQAYRQITTPPSITTSTAKVEAITGSFTAEAVVVGKQYELAPESGGRIIDLPVAEGDLVRRDQVLAVLDTEEADTYIAQAEASYRASTAAVAQAAAQLELARREYLAGVESAEARVRQAEAGAARARLGSRPEEISQAEHRLERANAGREEAEKAYRRAEYLYREGAISGAANDAAIARYKAAKAEVEEAVDFLKMTQKGARAEDVAVADAAVDSARADLRRAMSLSGQIDVYRNALRSARAAQSQAGAAMDQVSVKRAKQVLRAPATGTVSRIRAELGMVTVPGQPVFTLSTREDLHIEAEVNTEDAAKVSSEMRVVVTSAAYPGRQFPAKVKQIMPVGELKAGATIRTRVIRLRVMLEKDWDLFKPGMELDVEGEAVLKQSLVIPSDALVLSGATPQVWVVRNSTVRLQTVKPGYAGATTTEILSGLKAGDEVVVAGKEDLRDGSKVKVGDR